MTETHSTQTRFNGRMLTQSKAGEKWAIRYGSCTCVIFIKAEWISQDHAKTYPMTGCITVSGPALEAVETAIAWDRDLRAESKRLG